MKDNLVDCALVENVIDFILRLMQRNRPELCAACEIHWMEALLLNGAVNGNNSKD